MRILSGALSKCIYEFCNDVVWSAVCLSRSGICSLTLLCFISSLSSLRTCSSKVVGNCILFLVVYSLLGGRLYAFPEPSPSLSFFGFLSAVIYLQSYHVTSCHLGSGSDGSRQSFCLLWWGGECSTLSSQSLSTGCHCFALWAVVTLWSESSCAPVGLRRSGGCLRQYLDSSLCLKNCVT